MSRLFGTDGVRGLANGEVITADFALRLSQAAARVLRDPEGTEGRRPVAVVGRDPRASGEFLSAAVVAGLASSGIDVLDAGVVPTPAVAFLTAEVHADFGVMLSASHNAMPDNGIKFFSRGGVKLNDYLEVVRFLDDCPGIAALELNISCPNVEKGGFHFNKDPRDTRKVTAAVRKAAKNLPLWVKLSPNVTDIREFARACEDAGADAVSVINTLVGMAIDVEQRRPRIRFLTGGLSGPAIKPIALRMVWEACQAVRIPVIGVGGIACTEDALEFLIAGAHAVQIGTANFYRPDVSQKIAQGLQQYCRARGIEDIHELIGSLRPYE